MDAIGGVRDLFLQRLVFRTVFREATEAALGSGSGWAEKAPAHRIARDAKGVGYAVDTLGVTAASDEAVLFRAVYLTDAQVRQIAAGQIPIDSGGQAWPSRPARDDVAVPSPEPEVVEPPSLHVVPGGAA